MSFHCPSCQQMLTEHNGSLYCENCAQHWVLEAQCPDCHQPLTVLKACGAIDYFCQNGHGLISKKRVVFQPQPCNA